MRVDWDLNNTLLEFEGKIQSNLKYIFHLCYGLYYELTLDLLFFRIDRFWIVSDIPHVNFNIIL